MQQKVLASSGLISGFSKKSKSEKIEWLLNNYGTNVQSKEILEEFWVSNIDLQSTFDGFSENTISNFIIPFGIAPNFVINDKSYAIPMAIEESSVVAAASSAAKYWMTRGGFKAQTINTTKIGQLHFRWNGSFDLLKQNMPQIKEYIIRSLRGTTTNMDKRGGGILNIEAKELPAVDTNIYQLLFSFETCDSMGANFINSVLEESGHLLKSYFLAENAFKGAEKECEIIMAILSNYTPDCTVKVEVSCPFDKLGKFEGERDGQYFAEKFHTAVQIAKHDVYRATTHNKGIFNGIDAVVLATANDFRAIEASGHAYASRDGQYRSLTDSSIENKELKFWIEVPLALGTVGGLTNLHPLAKLSLDILGNPSANELMQIIATTGLAQNFGAVRSLVTTGIQKGHMKMHLMNILQFLSANDYQKEETVKYFQDRIVSFTAVRQFLDSITPS